MNPFRYRRLTNLEKMQIMAECKRVTVRNVSHFKDGDFQTYYIGRLAGIDIKSDGIIYHKTKEAALQAARDVRANLRKKLNINP